MNFINTLLLIVVTLLVAVVTTTTSTFSEATRSGPLHDNLLHSHHKGEKQKQKPSLWDTVFVLSPLSGKSPSNSNNVPLFENVSLYIPRPDASKNETKTFLHFCFATGYRFDIPIETASFGRMNFTVDTHLFYENMFMGLEFVKGSQATSGFGLVMDGMLNLTIQRQVASSQAITQLVQDCFIDAYFNYSIPASERKTQLTFQCERLYKPFSGNFFNTFWEFITAKDQNPSLLGCPVTPPPSPKTEKKKEEEKSASEFIQSYVNKKKKKQQEEGQSINQKKKKKQEQQYQEEVEGKGMRKKFVEPSLQNDYDQAKRIFTSSSYPSPQEQKMNLLKKNRVGAQGVSYVYFLEDAWNISHGDFAEQGFLIALQGLVNRDWPTLFFIYPPSWPWTDSKQLFDFFNDTKMNPELNFVVLRNIGDVIDTLVNGGGWTDRYVQWSYSTQTAHQNKQANIAAREGLLAGFALAGVESALLLPTGGKGQALLSRINAGRKTPLTLAVDIANKFDAMTRVEISMWLYKQIWHKVSKDSITFIGGVQGDIIQPSVADWAVARATFVCDLSTSPYNTQSPELMAEYALAKKLMGEMNEGAIVFGWHFYGHDEEHTYTTLASQSKMSVHGLNTNVDQSFSHRVPMPSGYRFRPNKRAAPSPIKSDAVYMTLVQTDGLGLGSWVKPDRGEIPYVWEVTIENVQVQPSVVRYFYSNATDNDFFTAALSGFGYSYPRAIPKDYLPKMFGRAQHAMTTLGLESMVVFDASEAGKSEYTTTSNTNLNESIVDSYCEFMPNTKGWVNGYTNAYTFQKCPKQQQKQKGEMEDNNNNNNNKKKKFQQQQQQKKEQQVGTRGKGGAAMLSFDYYLDMSRSQKHIVDDLVELTVVNHVRPYFVAVHVREFNSEGRVAEVMQKLKQKVPNLELVTMDNLVEMAAERPTFRPHHH